MAGADDDKKLSFPKFKLFMKKYHPGGWKIHDPIRFYFKETAWAQLRTVQNAPNRGGNRYKNTGEYVCTYKIHSSKVLK